MGLINPLLWQGIPFGHPDGALDFYGHHGLWHTALAEKAMTVQQVNFDTLPDMGDVHQTVHVALARAFGLTLPDDFSLFDLRQRDGWVLFMQAHSLEHARLRAAAGL
jgi:hypothetical protein